AAGACPQPRPWRRGSARSRRRRRRVRDRIPSCRRLRSTGAAGFRAPCARWRAPPPPRPRRRQRRAGSSASASRSTRRAAAVRAGDLERREAESLPHLDGRGTSRDGEQHGSLNAMRAEMLEPCAGEGEDGSRRRLRPVQLKMHVRFPEALADLPDDERQAAPTRESLQQNLPPEPAMLAPREPPPRTPVPSQDLPRPSHQVCGKPAAELVDVERSNPVADHLPLELRNEAARRVVITVRVQEEHERQVLERPEIALLDAYPAERIPVGFAVASDRDAEARLPRTSLGPRRVCSHR